MMTRKNQVDDLLARFERKSITQKKCPYCAPNHSKDLFSSDGSDKKHDYPRKSWYRRK